MADPDGRAPHYFDEQPNVRSRPEEYVIEGPAGPLRIVSDAGVFSHGRLDRGTAVLLDRPELDSLLPGTGNLLDLGCGAGPIAVWLASRRPACTVWAVDTNARAVELCAGNARRNGLANVRACSPEGVDGTTRFAAIVTNPPVRVGKSAMHEMLRHWLSRLEAGGSAYLVVGRHLGADSLVRWLEAEGFVVARMASAKGYRVLRAALRVAEG